MLSIHIETSNCRELKVLDVWPPISGRLLTTKLQEAGISNDFFFIKNNGRLVEQDDLVHDGHISLAPKLCGGKGGFGSMLRAIGAQIEKTTNREACRDLSGRRLRDINEEKRLKAWLDKQSERDDEAVERKKRKLAKLCAEPKHEFKDKSYEEQRSSLTERVEDAVEVGFATASTSTKRAADKDAKTNAKKKVKTILDLDEDIDSDDLESSDDDSDAEGKIKKPVTVSCGSKSDSEHSSDASSSNNTCSSKDNESETSVFVAPLAGASTPSHLDDTSR
ncbi:hypothetical protein QAD02_004644 [Eretmocerus hayati]|uniref:Uncharacterized protein n=1 Tax=Eretmocerus hayati TaxID=131215 RepID=A0ACC2NQK3_9HYME|nr:hypothetical protein QAD02_004644 [Eretmocerus hayati]